MVVPRKPRAKPRSVDEVLRVIRIFNMLAGEKWEPAVSSDTVLLVAERIAARTED